MDPETTFQLFLDRLRSSSIAESTLEANQQHYELPPEFFELILGPRRKYSGCEWPEGVTSLEQAELTALETVVTRSGLSDGQSILELGCGWGSLSLYLAERFPTSKILAVSNSTPQRHFIEAEAKRRSLGNLTVLTADINEFEPHSRFDRILTIEMLEHVRNYPVLFGRIRDWLVPDGRLFVHVFRHKDFAYTFEAEGSENWMGRHFFTGGVMPSHDLLIRVQSSLSLEQSWQINGTNYARTADAWLRNLNANRIGVEKVLEKHYGTEHSRVWLNRWRMFFIACRELFGFKDGSEWGVSHYLFKP